MSNIATKYMIIKCPYCAFSRTWSIRRNKRKCKRCKREFSEQIYPITGIRSTSEEWIRCIIAFVRQRTLARVQQETGIPRCRSLIMVQYLRQCMATDIPSCFLGPIEMDETYIGGQRKNKRLHMRRISGKKGHGTDKLPIVGLFDRASGQVIVRVEPKKLDITFILGLLKERVVTNATVYTDGFKMYRVLKKHGFNHEYVDHDGGELVRGNIHTNNIEGFWGILKRMLGCIGGIRRDRLPLFVGEITWRFNHRKQTFIEQEQLLAELLFHRKIGGRS